MRMKSIRTHTGRIGRKISLNGVERERDEVVSGNGARLGDKISDYLQQIS